MDLESITRRGSTEKDRADKNRSHYTWSRSLHVLFLFLGLFSRPNPLLVPLKLCFYQCRTTKPITTMIMTLKVLPWALNWWKILLVRQIPCQCWEISIMITITAWYTWFFFSKIVKLSWFFLYDMQGPSRTEVPMYSRSYPGHLMDSRPTPSATPSRHNHLSIIGAASHSLLLGSQNAAYLGLHEENLRLKKELADAKEYILPSIYAHTPDLFFFLQPYY